MPTVHFLNVGSGDCILIEHGSGRVTMIDVCSGNIEIEKTLGLAALYEEMQMQGNFQMCEKPTNPIGYLQRIGCKSLFRFILSHPDMDHLDGFKAIREQIGFTNFWDCGVRREKPDFGEGYRYSEEDWDEYVAVRDGKRAGITVVTPRAGSNFKFANQNEDGSAGGDCLSVVSPNQARVDEVNNSGEKNGGSYIIVYRTIGGKIIFPGDAHDKGWEIATTHYPNDITESAVLIAPHHGRDSDCSFDFLDAVKPKLALFGCAPSEHLAYPAYGQRKIPIITNNQAGNVILDANNKGIDVHVENLAFAKKSPAFDENNQKHGCYYIGSVQKSATV